MTRAPEELLPGHATPEGTARFRDRFRELAPGHFREMDGVVLSSIGLGTYLGEADEATDRAYEEAVREALGRGCNVFDAAVNYRHQRSERALGRALRRAFEDGLAARDEVFVSTKGGYLPFDGELPEDPRGYLRRTYLESGLVPPAELAAGCHSLAPGFLADQLSRSRRNLGLGEVDLYYLHNPEAQAREVPREELYRRLRRAMEWLQEAAAGGEVRRWGVATWDALRVGPGEPGHLPVSGLRTLGAQAAGDEPGRFAAAQLPLNLAMPEALASPTQPLEDVVVPALTALRREGLAAVTSASILQGRLARQLPGELEEAFPGLASDAQRALQFSRSAPGVCTALVGMSRRAHVEENLALAASEPAPPEVLSKLLGGRGP